MELNKQEYDKYVKKVTPTHPLGADMIRAFLVGGGICLLGQISTMGMMSFWGMEKEDRKSVV